MEKKIKTALIIIDLQNEFINGKIQIPYSSIIINKINKHQNKFDVTCFVKNIIPVSTNMKKNAIISDYYDCCIENTDGSHFPNELKINENIFSRSYLNGISGLLSKNHNKSLFDFLKENQITHVFIGGVPGDYSVKQTAVDCISNKFKTYIIIDMIKTLNSMNNFINFTLKNNIPFINTNDISIVLNGLKSKYHKTKVNKLNK